MEDSVPRELAAPLGRPLSRGGQASSVDLRTSSAGDNRSSPAYVRVVQAASRRSLGVSVGFSAEASGRRRPRSSFWHPELQMLSVGTQRNNSSKTTTAMIGARTSSDMESPSRSTKQPRAGTVLRQVAEPELATYVRMPGGPWCRLARLKDRVCLKIAEPNKRRPLSSSANSLPLPRRKGKLNLRAIRESSLSAIQARPAADTTPLAKRSPRPRRPWPSGSAPGAAGESAPARSHDRSSSRTPQSSPPPRSRSPPSSSRSPSPQSNGPQR